jgi:enamine deaminase RidA (YjgF/YER057c/UK114 family)
MREQLEIILAQGFVDAPVGEDRPRVASSRPRTRPPVRAHIEREFGRDSQSVNRLPGNSHMTIVRHNPRKVLSDAVEAGNIVFLAGQVAADLGQDVSGQTRQVLQTIDGLLQKAGTTKSNILSANIWLTDIRNRDAMNSEWLAWIDPSNLPARATVEAKLADPRMLVEIAVIAAK